MKDITTSLKMLSETIKKTIDITNRTGFIMYSSDSVRVGSVVNNFDCISSLSLDKRHNLFIHIENTDMEVSQLVRLILKDKIPEGAAENYQQFLTNIMDGYNYSEEDCRQFKLPYNCNYIVYCIGLFSEEYFNNAYSLISNSFCENNSFRVFPSGNNIIVLEKVDNFTDSVRTNAETIKDIVNSELYTDVWIGIGNIHTGIMSIGKSLYEAREAARIGKLFNIPKGIYIFRDILIERMVAQIPGDKVQELINEIFLENIGQALDEELIRTAQIMFQNNLNISDSSKVLYIHRNTLLYRLDKIQKHTGLDIRRFEDAVIFKLGLLLKSI